MNNNANIPAMISAGAAVAGIWLVWVLTAFSYDRFMYPLLQLCLFIPTAVAVVYFWRNNNKAVVRLSSARFLEQEKASYKGILRPVLFPVKMVAVALLIMAFSRPQNQDADNKNYTEGIDIVMSVDVSPSMLARDLRPDRLEASKKVVMDFVAARPNDRFGLIAYSGNARTMSPLTTDTRQIIQLTGQLEIGMLQDGTAIGLGLGYAVNRLRESKAASKVVILLTDGENNVRAYPPLNYADAAAEYGIKVYTIGVGKKGMAEAPVDMINGRYVYGMVQVNIDEDLLRQISDITGGRYFRATDNSKLKAIYEEIDQLERSEFESKVMVQYAEAFFPLALIGLLLIALEFTLRETVFRSAV